MFQLWELPEALVYHVVSFVAPPTHRARILCHQIAPLCQASRRTILEEGKSFVLWDTVLNEDYGVTGRDGSQLDRSPKRCCKRLRRSPVDRVRDAHNLLKDHTEIAFYYLSEMTHSSKKGAFSQKKLGQIFNEYGPNLRINDTLSSGGTYLVEVVRSRNASQRVILHCVQELVERFGAELDLATYESKNSSLTALCVAAVRGMPGVVKYLLTKGASADIRCSGRFRLSTNPKKSVKCSNSTPLEFTQAMWDAERASGASLQDLTELSKCVKLLQPFDQSTTI